MRDLSVLLEREKELKVKFDSLMAFVQPYVTEFKDRASLEELKQYDSLESYLRDSRFNFNLLQRDPIGGYYNEF